MKKANQKTKLKEPVRLRAKMLANGNKSLYLDTYHQGKRVYEFLRLYLIPEKTAADKAQNASTLQAASAIKATRIIAHINGKADIKPHACQLSLQDWTGHILKMKSGLRSESSARLMMRLCKHLQNYTPDARLAEADRDFCIGFANYLRSAQALNSSKHLMQATQFELLNALSIILNEAVRANLIVSNPMRLLNASERIKKPESTREYLTPEEVKLMITAAADNIAAGDDVAAFLFCCFCGLRYSDISRLTWGDISDSDNGKRISIVMKKTHRRVEVPISEYASSMLPPSGGNNEKVFTFPPYWSTLRRLKKIAEDAGIKKSNVPRRPAHIRHHDADCGDRSLHNQQTNRTLRHKNHTNI